MSGPGEASVSAASGNGEGRYVLNPYLTVTHCGSNELLIKHGRRSRFSRVLRDEGGTKLLGRLLRHLNEPLSLSDLEQRRIVRESEREDASKLVDFLVKEQILIPPQRYLPHVYLGMQFGGEGVEQLGARTVGFLGSGFLGSRIARELSRLRVKRLVLLDDRRAAPADRDYFDIAPDLVEAQAPYVAIVQKALSTHDGGSEVEVIEGGLGDKKALTRLFESSDFVVAALEFFSPAAFHEANEVALTVGKPWISVYVDGSEALIGPIYVPGETLCYNEFEIQNEASSRLQADYLIYKETLASARLDAPHLVLPPFLSVVSGWATTAALSFLTSGQSFVVGRCVRVDFERFAVDYQDVLRLPRCPACAAQRPAYRHTLL
jgi:bacteriocin biosynthesis cyclodehydratase domain-containing protein